MKKKELLKRIEYLDNQLSVLSNKINPKHEYTSPYDPKYLKTVLPQDYKTDYIEVSNYDATATVFNGEKKEWVAGKWYKGDYWLLMYDKDLENCSGWYKNLYVYKYWSFDTEASEVTEATPQEIESALIKEAKRIGHKYDAYSWNHEQNTLYGNRCNEAGHDILFENGVWSEVIKPEENKTLSIEDIEKKVVKFAESVDWDFDKVSNNIDASDDVINWEEYNVLKGKYSSGKTRYIFDKYNKPKIGDVIAVYNQDEFKCIEVFREYHKHQNFDYITYKTITQQEAIDLLFNK